MQLGSLLSAYSVHFRAIVFYLAYAIILFVFFALLLFTIKHKKTNKYEIMWSLTPFVMLFLLLIPIFKAFFQ